jgi:hypothetical protein
MMRLFHSFLIQWILILVSATSPMTRWLLPFPVAFLTRAQTILKMDATGGWV